MTPPAVDPGDATTETVPISGEIERVSREVKEPGEGHHWYDLPYGVLDWLARGWPRRILPAWAQRRVNSGLNFLLAFQLDWNRAESRLRASGIARPHLSSAWAGDDGSAGPRRLRHVQLRSDGPKC